MSAAAETLFSTHRIPLQPFPVHRSALELRYQVYCGDCGFLAPEDYPEQIETDEHDDNSAHFYEHDAQGKLAGYVRLVRADASQRFPLQDHCQTHFTQKELPDPRQAAEISRLMVRCDYRRRRGEGRRRGESLADETRQEKAARTAGERRYATPQLLMNLYRQMYEYSCANGIRYWYAAMERPLARSMMRMSVRFARIGPECDYYGPVTPYLVDLQNIEVASVQSWLLKQGPSAAPAEVTGNSVVEVDFTQHKARLNA